MAAQIQEKRLSHSVCRTPEPEVDSDGDLDFGYRPSAKLRRTSGPCHRAIQSPGIRHQSFGVLVNSYRRAGSKSASLLNRPHYLWSSRRFLCVSALRLGRTPSADDGRCSARGARPAVPGPPTTPINTPGCGSAANQSPRRLRTMARDFIEFGGKGCVTRIHVAKTHALSVRALSRPASVGCWRQGRPCEALLILQDIGDFIECSAAGSDLQPRARWTSGT